MGQNPCEKKALSMVPGTSEVLNKQQLQIITLCFSLCQISRNCSPYSVTTSFSLSHSVLNCNLSSAPSTPLELLIKTETLSGNSLVLISLDPSTAANVTNHSHHPD